MIMGILPCKRKVLGPEEGMRGNTIKGTPAIVFGVISICLGVIITLIGVVEAYNIHRILSSYRGDGRLIVTDFNTPKDKFILDLGPIDLSKKGTYQYRLTGLPAEDYTVGLELPVATAVPMDSEDLDITVHAKLETQDGTVFQYASSLRTWELAHDLSARNRFYFLKGRQNQFYKEEGGVTVGYVQKLSVGIDGGWGTSFTPQKNKTYMLKLEINPPNKKPSTLPARLKLRSGAIV